MKNKQHYVVVGALALAGYLAVAGYWVGKRLALAENCDSGAKQVVTCPSPADPAAGSR
jgi:hypothetical protein